MKATRYLPLIIGIDKNGESCARAYGVHVVYVDVKLHSRMFLEMERGAVMRL